MPNAGFNDTADQNDNWHTPSWLFKALDAEFAFDCDAAADEDSAKCRAFIRAIDCPGTPALATRFFCNPPYSNIEPFVRKALSGPHLWVFILPVRTRAVWFEMLCDSARAEFRWFRKRIAFDPPVGVEASQPRMDTFICVVRPENIIAG